MTPRPVLPAYFHPQIAAAEWATVRRSAPRLGGVVINVADGPGDRMDADFLQIVRDLQPDVALLGYVDMAYGQRSTAEVEADVAAWRDLYGIRQVFLDQCPPTLTTRVKELLQELAGQPGTAVTANPGVEPEPTLLGAVDACVTFEGTWQGYVGSDRPTPSPSHPTEGALRLHLVYDAPLEEHEAVRQMAARSGAGCYVTDGAGANPWDHVSPSLALVMASSQ